ncbi:MAG: response regulator transcription factor [Umezawaea sp.]
MTATLERARAAHTTVLIAGDHPIYRSGLHILLDEVEAFHVVGESGTGSDVVAMAHALRPQVVVMDIVLLGEGIADLISPMTWCCPDTAVLIISPTSDRETFLAAMRAGARGYLLNGACCQDLVMAVEMVRSGGLVFDSCASDWVIEHLSRPTADPRRPEPDHSRCDVVELIPGQPGAHRVLRPRRA